MSRTPAMIDIRQATKRYDEVVAVDEVSLQVERGEVLVLLGGSGSGKTTTLKMVNRLIEPTSGEVVVDGQPVSTLAPAELRRRIGYVFQDIGLFPHMTVAENVAITPRLLGWSRERIDARVQELLELVELDPRSFADRRPDELSGGQQQRVGVARALAAEATLMLLDEPFGALDPLTRDTLQRSFGHIREATGLTALFVTHDILEAITLGDRIGVMQQGRLLQVGTSAELLQSPADEYVRDLVSTPTRQAALIDELLEQGSS